MIRTFHSFGAWLLRRNTHLLDLPNHFGIYDEEDSLSLLKTVFETKPPQDQLKDLADRISRVKDQGLGPEDDLSDFHLKKPVAGLDFPHIYHLYQQRLHQSGNADFGDLIRLSVKLLRSFPEVRQRISRRFRIILVDEFQDSNIAQFELLSELYDRDNYLCVVGDEDQSIYGFRGADVNNILNFPDIFPETSVIRLEENYRSTQNILEVAGRVVEHNSSRLGKTLWTRKPSGAPVVFAQLEDQNSEAQFCAELLKDGDYRETAILYRMNFQSRVFETLFQRLGIPYRVVGTLRFYEREEVKDALAYLALLSNPKDEVAFRRAVNKPRRGLGPKSLKKVIAARDTAAARGDLLEACRLSLPGLSAKAEAGMRAFLSTLDSLREYFNRPSLADLLSALIKHSGLYDHYRDRDESGGTARLRNLEELVNAAAEYCGDREGLSKFLESVELDGQDENPFQAADKVTLITVHNTKGLEFDRVIITGLENGIFPHYSSTSGGLVLAGDELEEERRLFYVGATRARETLYLTACRTRTVFGSRRSSEPSQFIDEIPKEFLALYGTEAEIGEDDGFPLGCGVYHEDYGPGVITRKWLEQGERAVIVRFDSGKSGRFILDYSHLERISREY
ncbi:ATP-dependent DNA helicase UvrD1 [subsurface metagenome]